MIPREETEDMNTKKDDGDGNDEEDVDLEDTTIIVIMKMYNSNNFWNIKWVLKWAGTKGNLCFLV
jgi:hypothetical protein